MKMAHWRILGSQTPPYAYVGGYGADTCGRVSDGEQRPGG